MRAGNRFSASSQHELHRDEEKALMSDDITFDKNLDLVPGHAEEVVPGVRRVLADNGGPFTFKGTLTYIVGKGKVAIVDPGPDDANHIKAVLDAVRGETVTHIFVTHTHRDHSPAVPAIKAATGATVYAEGPHRASRPLNAGEAPRAGAERGRGAGRRRTAPGGEPPRRGPDPAPQGARGFDSAPARQGRDRYRNDRARDLYRARSAADERGRLLGAGAHGRPGCARRGRDRRAARDQRRLSAGADLTA